ncbi:diguanylate cyclase domain-containing protein [Clostridium sp.]|uniref:sensor domain-containing diguanylate cyclase/phosphohydrolase n=1 Tax=Clostridium sp. TaxID=1506 RepID=UPI00284191F9|nr:HD domain-containing phosphohydrolase [Clostridium sp.]MDR3593489.1 diguanylate cyclase [Clostridium sp.]
MEYKLFKLLVDNLSSPVWIKDLDLRFIYVNKEYMNICKGENKEFIGLKHEEIFDKEITEDNKNQCNLVIDTLEPLSEECYFNEIKMKRKLFPLIDEEGKLQAIAGIYSNLTDIKQKENIIEQQENILKVVMDVLPGMVFYKDKHGKYVYANKEFNKFYNKTDSEELSGKTNFEIHPTEELAKKYTEEDKEVLQKKKSITYETILNSHEGEEIYTEAIKVPVIDKNEAVGVVGLILDVTEKKEIEEKLRRLSFTDILTGLYNRTYFEEKVKELFCEKYLPIGVIMGDANGLKLVNDTLGHSQGDELLKQIANILRSVCNDEQFIFRTGGDEFVILVPNATDYQCEDIIKRIFKKCKNYKHDLINVSISLGTSLTDNLNKSIYNALKEADDKVYRQKLLNKSSLNGTIINSLQMGLQTKSLETEEHTERVLQYAVIMGQRLSLPISLMDELKIVAKLHDIGKIGIDEELLLKTGILTNDEFEIVKTHTEKGYRIIKASNQLDSVAQGVLAHHERWDGNGYPLKLKGESIPLVSRIVSIADSYEAMTNNDTYRKPLSKKDSINELKRCAGKQFDPDIVRVFIKYLEETM